MRPEINIRQGEGTRFESTLRGLAAVIRRGKAAEMLELSPQGFLEAAGVQAPDVEQLAALGAERLLVYRRLVFNRFVSAVEMSIPRTAKRRNYDVFKTDVSKFLDQVGSQSPYLRDIAGEFVSWAIPVWQRDPDAPDYLPDLARHELLSFEIASMPQDATTTTGQDLDLEKGVVFQEAARVVHYDFDVHRLPADEDDRSEPVAEPTALLAYRDEDHRVRYLELGPVAAAVLVELLHRGTPLREAIVRGCSAANMTMDDPILSGIATLLADLAERGVLIGPATQ